MKKYKLIKWYPSLRTLYKVGDVVESTNTGSFGVFGKVISSIEIENNPEFWEEVNEKKDWEIIEYETITVKGLGNLFIDNTINSKILKIKRLSDGEVFTIGDTIQTTKHEYSLSTEIVEIKLNVGLIILMIPTSNKFRFESVDLCDAKKIEKKEPVLTTEDGVHLYERDQYWTVFTKASSEIKAFTLCGPHRLKIEEETKFNFTDCKYFTQLDNAVKFIEESRPKVMYGVNESFIKTAESADKVDRAFPAGNWKWFDSEKERDLYIEENKPRFTKKELRDFFIYSKMNETPNFNTLLSQWINRKEK